METLGWFWPFLGAVTALGLVLQFLFALGMARRRWRPSRE
jgi:hypothetical protein